MKYLKRTLYCSFICCCLFIGTVLLVNWQYQVPVAMAPEKILRIVATPVFRTMYIDDLNYAPEKTQDYYIGKSAFFDVDVHDGWDNIKVSREDLKIIPQQIAVIQDIPFVYEDIDASDLALLRERYQLQRIIEGADSEYNAMLKLFNWVGQLWDHGEDIPPRGQNYFRPVELLQSVETGKKFWCEVAAKFTVYTATAMGWPARLVTISRDGYRWEHALAEVWSNEFSKWFVVDADYNILYEKDGVPLSAYELCHFGIQLQQDGLLTVRPIAPQKPSVTTIDLIPYYAYIHIDLRSDWLTRELRKGSPAGGDLSTWWTSRPELENLLTIKTRVNEQETFDWPVNVVTVYPFGLGTSPQEELYLDLGVYGYSPYFSELQWAEDGLDWKTLTEPTLRVTLVTGKHLLRFRIMTKAGWPGPEQMFEYQYD